MMPLKGRKQLRDALHKKVDEQNKFVRGVFISTLKAIQTETPVDFGTLRASWFLSVGVPANNGGSYETMPSYVLDKKVYFVNPQPYAVVAEYGGWNGATEKVNSQGYSRQAPQGMVRVNLEKARKKLKAGR